jgi:hypothetical protein
VIKYLGNISKTKYTMLSHSSAIITISCIAASVVNGFTFTPTILFSSPSFKQQRQGLHKDEFSAIGRKILSPLSMTGTLEAPVATDLALRYVMRITMGLACSFPRFSLCRYFTRDSLYILSFFSRYSLKET